MDAVSYPDVKVSNFIIDKVVPLRVPADAQPLSTEFQVHWTPTLVTLDMYGKEHYRTVGFLPPEELVPSLILGIAKVDFAAQQYNDALINLNMLLAGYPASSAAPEAVFLKGVCGYKSSKNAQYLKEAYEQLAGNYPASEWTKRANPYSLL
ncbi:hypothetical protein JN12_02840 [Geobacter argillaceus]|uniref:Tetratricopeptide repeat protein n=1 Tax=Geobacter argillaceus TaxID=345631 RepID=A0A562VK13_9BACT|nr:hypothetical protein JN12_02840 [Geobacter argillaceus]